MDVGAADARTFHIDDDIAWPGLGVGHVDQPQGLADSFQQQRLHDGQPTSAVPRGPEKRVTGVMYARRMSNTPPIILVPGYWLGAWAWDEVAEALGADGHDVTALTLPGLDSIDTDRSAISLADHIDAICGAVEAAGAPVVLAVHSGAGAPGYAATDRLPDKIAAVVYVDSGPATGALNPTFEGAEFPLPPLEELREEESFEGISDEQLDEFSRRAIPQPGGAIREAAELTNDARLDIPSTVLCTSFPSDVIKEAVQQGQAWIGGLTELRNITYVDVPTSHWPMWSKPHDTARVIGEVARSVSAG